MLQFSAQKSTKVQFLMCKKMENEAISADWVYEQVAGRVTELNSASTECRTTVMFNKSCIISLSRYSTDFLRSSIF